MIGSDSEQARLHVSSGDILKVLQIIRVFVQSLLVSQNNSKPI